jgi:DNA polymerase III epsilon subunit-like protein
MKYLFFDTETTGLPKNRDEATKGPGNWPHIVSLSWRIYNNDKFERSESFIIKPNNWNIPEDSINIHGITNEKAMNEGSELNYVINKFMEEFQNDAIQYLIAHNIEFDYNVLINAILWDLKLPYPQFPKMFCTMKESKNIMRMPYGNGRGGIKPPKLSELYEFVFEKKPIANQLHGSAYDTEILADIVMNYEPFKKILGLGITPSKEDKEEIKHENNKKRKITLFI